MVDVRITVTPPAPDREPPPLLFHYTTRKGLLGIVESKQVWATHARHLNDSAEYGYAVELTLNAAGAIRPSLEGAPEAEWLDDFVKRLKAMAVNTETYVFSMCADGGDRLSQWRGYTQPGDGYALGLESAPLWTHARSINGVFLVRCEYKRDIQYDRVKGLLDNFLGQVRTELVGAARREVMQGCVSGALGAFDMLATTIKDPAFEEEQEWRIVVTGLTRPPALAIKHRVGRSFVIPYVELPLANASERVPLRQVVIGPAPHMDLDSSAVIRLCRTNGISLGEVPYSTVPFRAW